MSMMPFRMSRRAVLAAPLLAMPLGGGRAIAAEGDFNGFLAGLRRDALAQGIRSGTVDLAFRYIQFLPRVIELDQHQPDHKLTFAEFMNKVVTQQRLDDAYAAHDLPAAMTVWKGDEEVDAICTSLFRELLTYMMEDPRNISFCIHLMFCAKNIERIGDHATNIAETVFYMIEGQQILDKRPKGDMTTFATTVPRN